MSTSDKRKVWNAIAGYLLAAALCAGLGFVYERFSHGVSSLFMVGAFVFPLLGGAGVLMALLLFPWAWPPLPLARSLYRSGIATLTVGSLLTGVFEIYGSAAPLVLVYWPAGLLLALAGGMLYFLRQPGRKTG